jgi:hypothetical protein
LLTGNAVKTKGFAKDVAALYGLSEYTVRDLWRRGLIPGVKLGGRLIFDLPELDKWFQTEQRKNVERNNALKTGKLRQVIEK